MRAIHKEAVLVLAMLALGACQEETLQIEPYKTVCEGVGVQSCLLSQEAGSMQKSLEYEEIEGFDYQWGHRYSIRVRVSSVNNPPADASSIKKSLVSVLSDEVVPAGTPFTIPLQSPFDFEAVQKSGGQYVLLGERAMTCAPALCQTLDHALMGEGGVVLELQLPGSPDAPLELTQVH